ncbi:MAG: altronate dehydratase family protein [Bacteroidota bacterium]
MQQTYLQVHPKDNVLAALQDLDSGTKIEWQGSNFQLQEFIPAKHKFTVHSVSKGEGLYMYGVLVGAASQRIPRGSRISTENTVHAAQQFHTQQEKKTWIAPDVTKWQGRTFQGYHRADGSVGTMNYWLVIPLVFCENRNIEVMKTALLEPLGYATHHQFSVDTQQLIQKYQSGQTATDLLRASIIKDAKSIHQNRVFPNVDGIKFLTHEGGCGGTREDADTLCRLLAAYITHPNVAGATVLSLGCQNAQIELLQTAIDRIDPNFTKPLHILEQQGSISERAFIEEAVKRTFVGLAAANEVTRQPAPLTKLSLGLECGGSDGFSGISANPTLGHTSDLLVALGAKTILAEFPELNGVEQELINRCEHPALAQKFSHLMRTYSERAEAVGSGFKNNPSPGNIKDGLITDAMKSAGAAKKGGTSPVVDVLDYTEIAQKSGLHLLCTPGNDVESTTGLAGAGANLIVFTTGLGTPTGNPITPVIKMSSNTKLYERMNDIIDFNAGTIISGLDSISSKGEALLEYLIQVASGEQTPHAVRLGQEDFIPWKRGVSL